MKKFLSIIFASAVIGLAAASADATLTNIGTATYGSGNYNLIYDDTPGLIWLDYANPINTWQAQMDWAAGLGATLTYNINPAYRVTWGGDWRLPGADPDPAYAIGHAFLEMTLNTSNEVGHLYYTELGNIFVINSNWSSINKGPFANLQPEAYWSGTAQPDSFYAWLYGFNGGFQMSVWKFNQTYAMAVRPADVAPVPEPGTLMLLGSGLAGFAIWRKRSGRKRG